MLKYQRRRDGARIGASAGLRTLAMGGKERNPVPWGGPPANALERQIDAVPDYIIPGGRRLADLTTTTELRSTVVVDFAARDDQYCHQADGGSSHGSLLRSEAVEAAATVRWLRCVGPSTVASSHWTASKERPSSTSAAHIGVLVGIRMNDWLV
jgi:hypothetical protein